MAWAERAHPGPARPQQRAQAVGVGGGRSCSSGENRPRPTRTPSSRLPGRPGTGTAGEAGGAAGRGEKGVHAAATPVSKHSRPLVQTCHTCTGSPACSRKRPRAVRDTPVRLRGGLSQLIVPHLSDCGACACACVRVHAPSLLGEWAGHFCALAFSTWGSHLGIFPHSNRKIHFF